MLGENVTLLIPLSLCSVTRLVAAASFVITAAVAFTSDHEISVADDASRERQTAQNSDHVFGHQGLVVELVLDVTARRVVDHHAAQVAEDDAGGLVVDDDLDAIERVESILEEELPLIHDKLCEISGSEVGGPKYRGVQKITECCVVLSFSIYCKGMYYGWLSRMLNRGLKAMCERRGIRLGMNPMVFQGTNEGKK